MNKAKKIKEILIYFLYTRIFLIVIMFICNILLKLKYPQINSILNIWDGEHYINIAYNGYRSNYLYAFFPGIPFLIKYLSPIGVVLLNQIFVILTSYLIYLIGHKHLKLKNPINAVIVYLISPVAIFSMLPYTESLFIFLSTYSYYLYKEKKNYYLLGIILGTCSLVRSTGCVIFFSIFIMMTIDWFKKKLKLKNIFKTYIIATIISCIYPSYLYIKTGSPFTFTTVQNIYWARINTNPIMFLYDTIKVTINSPNVVYIINSILSLIIMTFIMIKSIKWIKGKTNLDLSIYSILTILFLMFSIRKTGDPLTSYYRYLFACFPIYFMVPHNSKIYKAIGIFSVIASILLLTRTYFF